ncbi:hypothetical protein GJ744_007241 [Endocarpon pusillum]|uniref:Protein kinase domain-containing protein n=1 Tax=Endocarpon pusillum TaxID=364733 RepID=A0A8H7AL01_9EURO|nr:hypothetical protein GJ744_007241 [Endocarpon pusillum]
MSLDSLMRDLERRVDSGLDLVDSLSSSQQGYAGDVTVEPVVFARKLLSDARRSISYFSDVPLDYRSFVHYLADSRLPIIDPLSVDWGDFLGSGWTMSVYSGRWTSDDLKSRFVALKQLNLDVAYSMSSQDESAKDYRTKMASFTMELRLMSHELLKSHPNIVRLCGITWKQQQSSLLHDLITTPVLIVERASLHLNLPLTLENHVLTETSGRLSGEEKARLLYQVASGLCALHALGVVHGDMKPSNVLLFQAQDGLSAKISDFGFCIVSDNRVEALRGGTAFWSPPECLPHASPDAGTQRLKNTRDYYSYGLVGLFVLFGQIPFRGDEEAITVAKNEDLMKQHLDEIFMSHFPADELLKTGHELVIRFLVQWVLVRDPDARRFSFDLYLDRLKSSSWLEIAKQTLQSRMWDAEWQRFGEPSARLRLLSLAPLDSLYHLEIDHTLDHWGPLQQYERTPELTTLDSLQSSYVPEPFQRAIFQNTWERVHQDRAPNVALKQKFVANCYSTGFGVQRSTEAALEWYQKAAEKGDADAAKSFLQIAGFYRSRERLGLEQHCNLMLQVMLAGFMPEGAEGKLQRNVQSITVLRNQVLCEPSISEAALQQALETSFSRTAAYISEERRAEIIKRNRKFPEAFQAIENDDLEGLRRIIIPHEKTDNQLAPINSLLHYAVAHGRAGLVYSLIHEFGADARARDEDGLTPLALALRLGKTQVVRVLLFSDKVATIGVDDAAMDTASSGEGDIVQILYANFVQGTTAEKSAGSSMSLLERWSFFSLLPAIVSNNWSSFCTILSLGVDPNTSCPPEIASATTFCAPALLAATTYNALMLAALLAFGASANIRVPLPDGRTPLHLACGNYFHASSGLDGDSPEIFRRWPLDQTQVKEEYLPGLQRFCITILLRFGANLEAQDYHGNTPLMYALENGRDLLAATMLMEHVPRANINATDFFKNTALHKASDQQMDVIDFCLGYGADVELKNHMGETALGVAAKEGSMMRCARLLDAGALIDARDENGQNCMHVALQKSHVDIVRMFQGALRDKSGEGLQHILLDEDCRGWTCLHTCIQKCAEDEAVFHPIFSEWLSLCPKDWIDHQDANGWSMLHMAVSYSLECCRTLLEHGSSASLADTVLGWTPLHNACNEANFDIINLMLQHGGDMNKVDHYRAWTPTDLLIQATDAARLADGGDDFDLGEIESDGDEIQTEGTDIDNVLFDEGYGLSSDELRHMAQRMALSMQKSESDEDENQAEGIDMDAVDEGYDISPDERRHIALRRALIMQKVSLYFTREALSRVSRSMQQVDFDELVEAERGKVFPQLLAQTGAKTTQGPSTDEQETKLPHQVRLSEQRNLPSCFIMNDTGVCVDRYYISPSASKTPRER